MISPQAVIDRILETTEYTNIDWLEELAPDLFEETDLPYIRVGFYGIESTNPRENLSYAALYLDNEDLRVTFIIHVVSPIKIFPTIHQNIFGKDETTKEAKLIGWNPYPQIENSSAFKFLSGSVIGLSQGKQKVQYLISCAYPVFGV